MALDDISSDVSSNVSSEDVLGCRRRRGQMERREFTRVQLNSEAKTHWRSAAVGTVNRQEIRVTRSHAGGGGGGECWTHACSSQNDDDDDENGGQRT